VIKPDNPCSIKLADTWITLNSGGGPTPDKPQVLLETPSDLNRVNSFLDLRVADIWACYKQWGDKGAFFLTEPLDNHGWEWRSTCVIPTATSSRSANTLKPPSTGSTTAVYLASDKQEKVRNFLGSACEAFRCLVRRAIKRGRYTQGPRGK